MARHRPACEGDGDASWALSPWLEAALLPDLPCWAVLACPLLASSAFGWSLDPLPCCEGAATVLKAPAEPAAQAADPNSVAAMTPTAAMRWNPHVRRVDPLSVAAVPGAGAAVSSVSPG